MVMGDDPGHQAPVMTPDQFAAFMEAQARQTERLLAAAREGAPAGAQGGARGVHSSRRWEKIRSPHMEDHRVNRIPLVSTWMR